MGHIVGEAYPVVDPLPSSIPNHREIRALPTGDHRRPKRGEWYLSGAIVEAYQAPNDLTTTQHIARLVRVREIVEVVEYL